MQNEREKLLFSYSFVWGKNWQKKKLWMLKQETNYKVDAIVALNLNIVFFFVIRGWIFLKRGGMIWFMSGLDNHFGFWLNVS